MEKFFSVKIGGQAGQGIKSAGLFLAKLATRSGYHIYNYIEYPSLVRGGHNVMQINISENPVLGPSMKIDFLIALNEETIQKHVAELTPGGGILYDSGSDVDPATLPDKSGIFAVPFGELAQNSGGKALLSNTVSLGAVAAILGADLQVLKDILADEFSSKGEEIVAMNHRAAEAGYNYIKSNYSELTVPVLQKRESKETLMVVNGNEGAAMGAIAGGMQFAAIYPMSPVSNILHILAAHQEKFGYVYKQPEDEISAINMAVGASYAGARSMTTTSGGGFCLMTETYGLAGMAEIPVVIIEGMRGAPATGIPTWSEQGDLRMVLHAHQGDFPRIVLAAGDPKETFYLTMEAFNLADKYQTPVVLLIDKNICENDQSYPFFDTSNYRVERGEFTMEKVEDFRRYALSENGISQRSIPGSGNYFIANSDEHDELGYDNEEIENRNAQMQKRMKKLETCAKEDMKEPELFGPEEADLTFVSWGSNKGSILQAISEYPNVNFLHITWMNPFPSEAVNKVLASAKHVVNVECNYSAQLGGLIREKTGIEIADNLLKYDGRPFFVEEITAKIEKVLEKGKLNE